MERLAEEEASPVAPAAQLSGQILNAGWWERPAHDHVLDTVIKSTRFPSE